jgi:hypothetical protein
MMIIAKEWLKEMKPGKATEKWPGERNPRIHEMSTMWKILSLTKTTDLVQEEGSHLEEEEEDPRDSRITTQKTRTCIVNIMGEDTTLKGAQKPRKTWQESSKRKR